MSATDLFRTHLSLIGNPASEEDLSIYSEDVVMTLVNAPEGHTKTLVGPAAIARFMGRIGEFFTIVSRPEPLIQETANGLVAEYKGDMISKETGRAYHQDYVAVVEVRGGQIAVIREYYDAIRVLRAIGDLDE